MNDDSIEAILDDATMSPEAYCHKWGCGQGVYDEPADYVPDMCAHLVGRTEAVMRPRLMPEGMEWPRFEDGEPVRIGDEFAERIYGNPCKVGHFAINERAFLIFDEEDVNDCEAIDHGTYKRVKRPAVLAADGKPLKVGQTVWHVATGAEYTVQDVTSGGAHLSKGDRPGGYCRADYLTHELPDSWERLEEDATLAVEKYRERHGIKRHDGMTWPQLVREDLVRRARALAGDSR